MSEEPVIIHGNQIQSPCFQPVFSEVSQGTGERAAASDQLPVCVQTLEDCRSGNKVLVGQVDKEREGGMTGGFGPASDD